jgi:hypothetical protein
MLAAMSLKDALMRVMVSILSLMLIPLGGIARKRRRFALVSRRCVASSLTILPLVSPFSFLSFGVFQMQPIGEYNWRCVGDDCDVGFYTKLAAQLFHAGNPGSRLFVWILGTWLEID